MKFFMILHGTPEGLPELHLDLSSLIVKLQLESWVALYGPKYAWPSTVLMILIRDNNDSSNNGTDCNSNNRSNNNNSSNIHKHTSNNNVNNHDQKKNYK